VLGVSYQLSAFSSNSCFKIFCGLSDLNIFSLHTPVQGIFLAFDGLGTAGGTFYFHSEILLFRKKLLLVTITRNCKPETQNSTWKNQTL
jgi:hypothetical protein